MTTTMPAEMIAALAESTTGKKMLNDFRSRQKAERQKFVDERESIEAEAGRRLAEIDGAVAAAKQRVSRAESELWNARVELRSAEADRDATRDQLREAVAQVNATLAASASPSIGELADELRHAEKVLHRTRFHNSQDHADAQETRAELRRAIAQAERLRVDAVDDPEAEVKAIRETLPHLPRLLKKS